MIIELSEDEKGFLRTHLNDLNNSFINSIYNPAKEKLGGVRLSEEVEQVFQSLGGLQRRLGEYGNVAIQEDEFPHVKVALLFARKKCAERQRHLLERTSHPDVQQNIDDIVAPIRAFLRRPWVADVEPLKLPRLTDVLTLEEAYDVAGKSMAVPEKEFDEKFGILQAQKTFDRFVEYARFNADLRNTEVTVAFVDIDNFKELNTKLTERIVDRTVLPLVMGTIEAHVFSHGNAFKFGGDEYVLLLPNMGRELATEFLFQLQSRVNRLTIPGVDSNLTLSIGFCTIPPQTFLTNDEILDHANFLMHKAKARKDCLAGFNGTSFDRANVYQRTRNDLLISANPR